MSKPLRSRQEGIAHLQYYTRTPRGAIEGPPPPPDSKPSSFSRPSPVEHHRTPCKPNQWAGHSQRTRSPLSKSGKLLLTAHWYVCSHLSPTTSRPSGPPGGPGRPYVGIGHLSTKDEKVPLHTPCPGLESLRVGQVPDQLSKSHRPKCGVPCVGRLSARGVGLNCAHLARHSTCRGRRNHIKVFPQKRSPVGSPSLVRAVASRVCDNVNFIHGRRKHHTMHTGFPPKNCPVACCMPILSRILMDSSKASPNLTITFV